MTKAYESCYTTVYLYLRLTLYGNGSGSVAHHKTVSGKQSFVDQKNGCELFRKEIQEIMDNAVSATKEATKFGMRYFNGTYPLSLRPWQTRTHCYGHIVADTNFSPFALAPNICCKHKKCF